MPDPLKEPAVRHGVYYALSAMREREREPAPSSGAGAGGQAPAPAPAPAVHATDAQAASDAQWMRQAHVELTPADIRGIVADTALHTAAAAAISARASEIGLLLPADKASKAVAHVLVKEKAYARLQAAGSRAVTSRIRVSAPSSVARQVVQLSGAVPASAPVATATALPLAARAADRGSSYPPVPVPQAPPQPPAPVAAVAVATAVAGVAVAAESAHDRKNRLRRERYQNAPAAHKESRNAKRRKSQGRGRYNSCYTGT